MEFIVAVYYLGGVGYGMFDNYRRGAVIKKQILALGCELPIIGHFFGWW